MRDVMLFGVLRMPYEMTMSNELSRLQFWQRVQEAADRLEAAERTRAEPTPASTWRDAEEDFKDWMRGRGPLGAGAVPERIFFAGHSYGSRSTPVAARELDVEAERREFEALIIPEWSRETEIDNDGDTVYVEDWMQGAFIGYQLGRAARSAAQSTAQKIVNVEDKLHALHAEADELGAALDRDIAHYGSGGAPVSTEQAGDAWIDLKQRKPRDWEQVLVALDNGTVTAGMRGSMGWHWEESDAPEDAEATATHWKPWPTAPSPNNSPVGGKGEQ